MTWHASAQETDVSWVAVRELGQDRLLVFGATENESACRAALSRWVMRQTREHFVPRLQALSLKTVLKYHRTFVKRLRTR
jgi:hypothetical protein